MLQSWKAAGRAAAAALPGLLAAVCAMAQDANVAILRAIESLRPGARVEAIATAPIEGLHEVFVDGEVVYVDSAGRYVLIGSIVDLASKANLTQERKNKLLAVNFAELPLDLPVKTVRGNGSRVLVAFEDPNCGYCKQLHATLKTIDNVSLYTFLVPMLGPDSEQKIRAVWCARSPALALHDLMQGGSALLATDGPDSRCHAPVDKLTALARRLRVQGTPTLIFHDGTRAPGLLPAAVLEKRLQAAVAMRPPGAQLMQPR